MKGTSKCGIQRKLHEILHGRAMVCNGVGLWVVLRYCDGALIVVCTCLHEVSTTTR
jgi:hypothetical protein